MINKRVTGFTMLELLIVMMIVGILLAVSYPSYMGQLRKSRRAESAVALESMAQAQERFYARFRTYTSIVSGGGGCAGQACGLGQPSTETQNEYYLLTANGNATSYTMTATAQGSQFKDYDCRTLTVNSVGIKGAASASGVDTSDECW